MKWRTSLIFFLASFTVGCASRDEAVFVTSTSISVLEGDTKPAGLNVGYKRVEGYIGPNNADGTAPPVLASIESNSSITNPKYRQLYATGDAAVIAVGGQPVDVSTGSVTESDVMFFGTSTNIGLSIGTTSDIPDSFNLGYKRQELSVIPLVKDGDKYRYPSVIASIDNVTSTSIEDVSLNTNQFFASGNAARALAPELGNTFIERSNVTLDAAQKVESSSILSCYSGVALNDLEKVWRHATDLNLFREGEAELGEIYAFLMEQLNSAVSVIAPTDNNLDDGGTGIRGNNDPRIVVTNYDVLVNANKAYSQSVNISNALETDRLVNLKQHRAFVCGLAKTNR